MSSTDDFFTETEHEQGQVEKLIRPYLGRHLPLQLHNHRTFLLGVLHEDLPCAMLPLDCQKPWIIYWILQGLKIVGDGGKPSDFTLQSCLDTLAACMNEDGMGFSGGFTNTQGPHLLTTFSAIQAICLIGTEKAFSLLNPSGLYRYLVSLKHPSSDGTFRVHENGEHDIRGVYAALAVAKLTNILDQVLVDNCLQFVISCQTYEGGFGGQPMNEAHGGYTYCAMAALVLLCEYYQTAEQQSSGQLDFLKENLKKINWTSLLCWIIDRQQESKLGGFQGRTNKLVDSCYSYWIGSLIPILRFFSDTFPITIEGPLRWDPVALITYVLDACQNNACPEENGPTCTLNEEEYASPVGGMLDKPEKYPDYYHTCYALSGLCIAVHDMDFLNLTEKEDFKAKLNLEHLPALHLAFCLPATCVEIMENFFL